MPRSVALLALLLGSCTCNDPGAGSLAHTTAEAFTDCSAAEIKFLAAKTGVQLAFGACGSNNFSAAAWSPDGTRVYFQLVFTGHVLDAGKANKPITALPVPQPIGPGAWLGPTRLAIPVISEVEGGPVRLAVLDVPPTGSTELTDPVRFLPLEGVTDVLELVAGPGEGEVLALLQRGATNSAARITTADGKVEALLPWLPPETSSLTWSMPLQQVAIGVGEEVRVHEIASGAVIGTWTSATRGTLHPEGRWLVLEQLGAPVSMFAQRSWDDLPPEVRAREEQRAQALTDRLPPGVNTTVRPPELSIVDRSTGRRVGLTGFQGDHFGWYEARLPHATFFLWGFEGKQVKRNVALVDLTSHLDAISEGTVRNGQVEITPGTVAPAPTDPPAP